MIILNSRAQKNSESHLISLFNTNYCYVVISLNQISPSQSSSIVLKGPISEM
uniref:Uncharacterized protein n=1 Tax=Rhizophora mucronata TaxID=61149 RepID=A0A2P2NF51_RHIMU